VTKSTNLHLVKEGEPADGGYTSLVEAAAKGERPALEALLLRAQEVAYRFGLTVCGHVDDAEDVMQEALLKTYRHVSRLRDPAAFRPWLYRTVRNACLMRRRRRAHEPARVLSLDELLPERDRIRPLDVPDPGRSPEALAQNTRLRRRLRRALRALPPAFRVIVFLREMEGLSTREVAEVTGLSEANVKARLHRARLQLQRQLGDEA
jgi:RNA polymerase sigma-70 factor, ECF subfamily